MLISQLDDDGKKIGANMTRGIIGATILALSFGGGYKFNDKLDEWTNTAQAQPAQTQEAPAQPTNKSDLIDRIDEQENTPEQSSNQGPTTNNPNLIIQGDSCETNKPITQGFDLETLQQAGCKTVTFPEYKIQTGDNLTNLWAEWTPGVQYVNGSVRATTQHNNIADTISITKKQDGDYWTDCKDGLGDILKTGAHITPILDLRAGDFTTYENIQNTPEDPKDCYDCKEKKPEKPTPKPKPKPDPEPERPAITPRAPERASIDECLENALSTQYELQGTTALEGLPGRCYEENGNTLCAIEHEDGIAYATAPADQEHVYLDSNADGMLNQAYTFNTSALDERIAQLEKDVQQGTVPKTTNAPFGVQDTYALLAKHTSEQARDAWGESCEPADPIELAIPEPEPAPTPDPEPESIPTPDPEPESIPTPDPEPVASHYNGERTIVETHPAYQTRVVGHAPQPRRGFGISLHYSKSKRVTHGGHGYRGGHAQPHGYGGRRHYGGSYRTNDPTAFGRALRGAKHRAVNNPGTPRRPLYR